MTLRDKRWTSVTSHQAHAQPPTMVRFLVEPQQPPEIQGKEGRKGVNNDIEID